MSSSRFLAAIVLACTALPAPTAETPAGRDRHGDPLPKGAVARMGSMRLRPDMPAEGVAFSPDGRTLATIGGPNVQLWDPANGRERRRFPIAPVPGAGPGVVAPGPVPFPCPGFNPYGHNALFSPDGKALIVADQNGVVRFLDVTFGAERQVLPPFNLGAVMGLSQSADGKLLAVACGTGAVVLWDVVEKKERHRWTGSRNPPLGALVPDGKFLVTTRADQTLVLVDTATNKEVRIIGAAAGPVAPGVPRQQALQRLVVSPDGKTVAYAGWNTGVTLASLETGKVLRHDSPTGGAGTALEFAPSGRFFAIASYPAARLIGTLSGREIRTFETAPAMTCKSLAFSPDGKFLAGVGQDGSVRLWEVASQREQFPPEGHPSNVSGLTFLDDGRQLASYGGDGRLVLWDAATGRQLDEHRGIPFNVQTMSATPDGKGVQGLGWDRSIHIWRPGVGIEAHAADLPAPSGGYHQQAVSPDGKRVAMMGNADRKVRIFEAGSKDREGRVLATPENVYINQMVFSPDSSRLASMGTDMQMRVWGCATGRALWPATGEAPRPAWAQRMLFSPDGRSLLIWDNELRICEVVSGRERAKLSGGMPVQITAIAWSPDGRLAARGGQDGAVVLYDAIAGKELESFDGHQGMIQSLAFSPDGRRLASGGTNGIIVVWQTSAKTAAVVGLPEARRAALWTELAELDGVRAGQALAALAEAPADTVALVRDHFRTISARSDARKLEKLIADLDSDEFDVREKAHLELAAAGAEAEEVMRKALDRAPSAEVKRRLGELLDRFNKAGVPADRLRGVRAVEALERIGTPQAKQLLEELARQGGDAVVDQEIKESLRRLSSKK